MLEAAVCNADHRGAGKWRRTWRPQTGSAPERGAVCDQQAQQQQTGTDEEPLLPCLFPLEVSRDQITPARPPSTTRPFVVAVPLVARSSRHGYPPFSPPQKKRIGGDRHFLNRSL